MGQFNSVENANCLITGHFNPDLLCGNADKTGTWFASTMTVMKTISRPLILLFSLSALMACSVARMDVHGLQLNSAQGGPGATAGKATEVFTADQRQQKVDILFIDDNSASMDPLQASLGSKFSSFANAVQGLDWQVGITTTDCSSGPWGICGSLLPMTGGSANILTPSTPNYATVFAGTIVRPETINCVALGQCPDGDSEPLRSLSTAMQKHANTNTGFFRAGGTLAVIILTNADEDNLAPLPSSTTPQAVVSRFNSIWGTGKQLRVYSIAILQGDSQCLADQQAGGLAAYGTYPIALASLTGGTSLSVCAQNYDPLLQQIGGALQGAPNVITLGHVPIPATVVVTLNPNPGISWTLGGDTLTFSAALPGGTQITVNYEY